MAGDRISEAYEGKLSEIMQINSRKRIDWFCDNVTGKNILDIGCSQGILPILLGKKGCSVVGIDNDNDSIAYALNALKSEEISVRERVEFICGDFLEYDFGDRKFDTIVMGEVMEHLFNPLLFLEKASELLKEDGLFVVSVPFGINRHPDHKRTYYFYDFYNQVNEYFCVEKVIFMGKWIAIKAVSKENSLKMPIQLDTMYPRLENAIYTLEEILEKERNDLKSKLARSDEFTKKLKEEKADLLVSVNDYKNQLQEAEKKQERIVADFERKQEEIAADFERKHQEDEKNNKRKLNESTAKYKRLEKRYADLRNSKLGKIQVKYWSFRNKCRKRFTGLGWKIRETAKKSPFLCNLVWKYRRKKNQQKNVPAQQMQWNQNDKESGLNAAQRRALFEEKTDKAFFDSIKDILGNIPESNGGRYYKRHSYKIGIIADEFLYAAFRDAADFVYITPENWKEAVSQTDFLLMVSAWRGLHEEWRGAAQEASRARELIYKIIEAYKEQGKVTVFYSKEDPPNYSNFVGIAKKCDYIFTTCAEVVENYKRDCGNDNVNVLCFGINPLYHNPVGIKNPYKKDGVIFSGSWMTKYPERLKDMHMLFDGVLDAGQKLKIIDRNYSYTKSEIYRYPEEYWPYVSPEIEHTLLQKVHKLYNWALNINTVTDSMTMFANRGYELQAAGNLLISNYSVGVNNRLPMVYTVIDQSEIGRIINGYTEEELYERQIAAVRSVMTGETAFDRVGQVIETIGLEKEANERKILVVADVLSDSIKEMFENQSYPFKKLISMDDFTEEEFEGSDMTAFFKDGMEYGMFYLEDMSNGFKYTDSSYITKDSYYHGKEIVAGKEHDYVSAMKNKYATLFWNEDFSVEQLKSLTDGTELENGYSIDHFNYNLEQQEIPAQESFQLSVIVPVYNNGRQLMGKAFSSLQRSSMFEDMEILLVDDGSTDGYTDKLVKYLEKRYANVKTYLFADGGSGSASRPRNKGAELASADYITYLDPDNEAVFDGYAELYDLSMKGDYDITVGNMLKLTTEISDAKYYKNFEKYGSDLIEDDTKKYMEKTNFSPMSIQAMVIKKSVILDNHIIQPVGAAGQDTLFCWELFFHAKKIKGIKLPIHIYYAAVEGSTVNNIGKRFFEKYYLIEGPRRQALEKYGVLDMYMKKRYNYYFVNWVLKKLSQAKVEEAEQCTKIVYQMHAIYQDVYLNNNKTINEFLAQCESGAFSEGINLLK